MLRVKKWAATSNEGETIWINYYKKQFPIKTNPASLYLKCLRYRHVCPNHFRTIVAQDPRLTRRQKTELTTMSLHSQPSKLFYWFVVELLTIRPVKINFSLTLLQKTLQLPHGHEIIRRTILGTMFLFLNDCGNIVVSNSTGLLGVITEDGHLWKTRLWSKHHSEFLNSLCCSRPEIILTSFSSICPFCGIDVSIPCSHGMQCMENYVRWVGNESYDLSILSK